jgi:hypothetical protein
MANNVNGNAPNAVVAKSTISFVDAGITSDNTEIIYKVDDALQSYKPGRAINGISGFVANQGYYLIAKQDMDLSGILVPPLTGISQLDAPTSFAGVPASDTQINLSWGASPNATGYVVDRATNTGFTTGVALAIYSGSGTSYNDTGRTASTQYFYRIRATAAGYADSIYATANATTNASGGSYDTDAQAYMTAAAVTNTTHKDAIDAFVVGVKGAGLWTSKMRAFWPLYGTSYSQAKFNLRNPADTDAGYRLTQNGTVTFSNGVLVTTTGVTDGFDTHFSATDAGIGQNDNCQFASVKTEMDGVRCAIGTMNPGGTCANYLVTNNAGALWAANMAATPDTSQSSGGSAIGRFYHTRVNGTQVGIYKNGTLVGTVNSNSTSPVNGSFYVCNGGNGSLPPIPARVSMAGIFKGLTGSEISTLDGLISTLETALGR